MLELLRAEQAATDARLVGHDGDGECPISKSTHHLEDTVDEAAVLDTMHIAGVLVDYAVAIEKEPSSSHHQPAVRPQVSWPGYTGEWSHVIYRLILRGGRFELPNEPRPLSDVVPDDI